MSPLFLKSLKSIIVNMLMTTPFITGGIMEFGEHILTYPQKQCVLSNAILIQWRDVHITSGVMVDANLDITITEEKGFMELSRQAL